MNKKELEILEQIEKDLQDQKNNQNKQQENPDIEMTTNEEANPEIDETEVEENTLAPEQQLDPTQKLQSDLTETKNDLLRLAAEFENYRKRTTREKTEHDNTAPADTVENLLPVLDNLERCANAPCTDENYKKGVMMTLTQLGNALTKLGVEEINALGEIFDPKLHEGIQNLPATDDYPENTVCNVLQKGYKFKDKVIRHAMVAVSE
jgi:molecular chaperone GrpE